MLHYNNSDITTTLSGTQATEHNVLESERKTVVEDLCPTLFFPLQWDETNTQKSYTVIAVNIYISGHNL